jgi:segregation and condensation protein B
MIKLDQNKLVCAIEAILFASGEPVSSDKIIKAADTTPGEFEEAIKILKSRFAPETSGISLVKMNDEYQLCTNREYIDIVRNVLDLKKNTPLSNAALEVLSVVAYNEPVTKAFIEQIRGVDCSGTVSSLVEKGLLEERGRLDLPGKPLIYGVTDNFLRCFGISSLEELPDIPDDNENASDANDANVQTDSVQATEQR